MRCTGIASLEGIDREHVEAGASRSSARRASPSCSSIAALLSAVGELVLRDPHHARVDLVEAVDVARPPVGGDGTHAEADDADACRPLAGERIAAPMPESSW